MDKDILHMKIDKQLKEKLRELAKQDHRTLTNYIEVALRSKVEEKGNDQARHQ